jgi:hypothetical protein
MFRAPQSIVVLAGGVVVDRRSWVERGVPGSARGVPGHAIRVGGWAPWAGDVEVVVSQGHSWWGRPGCLAVANTSRLSGYENSDAGPVPGWVVAVAFPPEGVYTRVDMCSSLR